MEVCEFTLLQACRDAVRQKATKYRRNLPRINHRENAWPRICNSSKRFIFVFSTQVSYFNLSLKRFLKLSRSIIPGFAGFCFTFYFIFVYNDATFVPKRHTVTSRQPTSYGMIRNITSHHITSLVHTYIYTYINVFFSPPVMRLSSCSRLPSTLVARPDPLRKFGPWPRSAARAQGVQSGKSARGGIPSTYSHPGP